MNIKTDESFKYDVEKLEPATEQFELLTEILDTASSGLVRFIIKKFNHFHIYKVNGNDLVKTADEKSNNLMLFHGTSEKGATGILKEGFRNSEEGWFGKGVYMTDCSFTAFNYASMAGGRSNYRYIFVNEVLESEKMQILEFDENYVKDVSTKPKYSFEKHVVKSSVRLTEKDYIKDFKGRRYVKTRDENICDEYIAEASVTTPRYLVVLVKG